MPPPHPTATAFSEFVFRKTKGRNQTPFNAAIGEHQKWIGAISEETHRQCRAVASQCLATGQPPIKKWKVLFEGQSKGVDNEALECRFLTVNGSPIRCRPDLVLQSDDDRKHKVVIIVERKVRTGVYDYPAVPDNCWENVRAQLWCYAWISDWDWLRHENVLLVAEYYWHPYPELGEPVYMGCRGIWRREDPSFNRESMGYFRDFGGIVDPRSDMLGLDT